MLKEDSYPQEGNLVTRARTRVADEIMEELDDMAEYSDNLSDMVGERLSPISRQNNNKVLAEKDKVLLEEYPPLFDEMRTLMVRIQLNLTRIEASMGRLEI